MADQNIPEGFAAENKPGRLINWNTSIPGIPEAYINSKGAQIIVGVLDTGVQADHPDLAANLTGGVSDFTTPNVNGIDDDPNGHGTFVAGVIGADSLNANGIIGVSPAVKLMVSKVQGNQASLPGGEQVFQGINYLQRAAQPPHIYNLSLGFEGNCSADLQGLLNSFINKSTFLVAAAGDNYDLTPTDVNGDPQQIQFPAAHPACIRVGTIGQDCLGIYNNMIGRVDIICPLISYWSCSNEQNQYYNQLQGSSMATAFISGIISLLLSDKIANGTPIDNLTKQDILTELRAYSTPIANFDFANANQFIFNMP